MDNATLGNTGLVVSKVCLGTMTLGNGKGLFKAISSVGQAGADEVVKTSIDGGINSSDTADNYAEGESEKTLGQSLTTLNIAAQGCLDRNEGPQRVAASLQTQLLDIAQCQESGCRSSRALARSNTDLAEARGRW